MRNHVQHVGLSLGEILSSGDSFSSRIIDCHKNSLVGKYNVYPGFFGRKDDYISGMGFTKQIENKEDMQEVVNLIKETLIDQGAKEVLFIFPSRVVEDDKSREALTCLFFCSPESSVMLKLIDIYRTEEGNIFGFGESVFSPCEVFDMGEFGILKGSFDEN